VSARRGQRTLGACGARPYVDFRSIRSAAIGVDPPAWSGRATTVNGNVKVFRDGSAPRLPRGRWIGRPQSSLASKPGELRLLNGCHTYPLTSNLKPRGPATALCAPDGRPLSVLDLTSRQIATILRLRLSAARRNDVSQPGLPATPPCTASASSRARCWGRPPSPRR
jgi:hypothetical protein